MKRTPLSQRLLPDYTRGAWMTRGPSKCVGTWTLDAIPDAAPAKKPAAKKRRR